MLRAWPIVLGALLALGWLVPATVGADSGSSLRDRASELSKRNVELASKSRGAVLDLYAADSQLTRQRAGLTSLRDRAEQVGRRRAAAKAALTAARSSLKATQTALARRLQDLYEQGDTDPLAVLLGASSIDDALSDLDSMDRIARNDRRVIEETRAARTHYAALERTLAARERELTRLAEQAEQAQRALEQARAQRAAYLASLASQRSMNASEIASLQSQAAAVEAKAQQLGGVTGGAAPGSVSGNSLTVTTTGYSLGGRTATGAPVGWGVVAVDPGVIPLGTRMSIPGYGEGVAADTGGAVQGATIDLWFPTQAQAAAWGRRVVTITLH